MPSLINKTGALGPAGAGGAGGGALLALHETITVRRDACHRFVSSLHPPSSNHSDAEKKKQEDSRSSDSSVVLLQLDSTRRPAAPSA